MHKPHSWIEINRAALEHNFKQLKHVIGPQKFLAPVIKGNAYGHGLIEVGRICQSSRHVDWVCVAALSEALKLRHDGFTKPILVLSYLDDMPELAVAHDIDVLIYRPEDFKELSDCAQKLKKTCHVHLKIDTGLSRFGVKPRDAFTFFKQALSHPGIEVRGIASHFSQAYGADLSIMSAQLEKFEYVIRKLESQGIQLPYQHICNSAVTLRLKDAPGTFFRPGIATYGVWPSEHVRADAQKAHPGIELKQPLTWKTRIIEIKQVPAQQPVGYDSLFVSDKPSTIAIIATGYADGYRKSYENTNMFARVHDCLVPIIGRIAMNVMLLDVTSINTATPRVGDEVILLGDYDGLRMTDIAQRYSGNPREITTIINPDLPRILV